MIEQHQIKFPKPPCQHIVCNPMAINERMMEIHECMAEAMKPGIKAVYILWISSMIGAWLPELYSGQTRPLKISLIFTHPSIL